MQRKKTTEELILDFMDRFDGRYFHLDVEKREVDASQGHLLLWFKVNAVVSYQDGANQTIVYGESYTLDKALGQMSQNAMKIRKPSIWPKRELVDNNLYGGMENIVKYSENPNG